MRADRLGGELSASAGQSETSCLSGLKHSFLFDKLFNMKNEFKEIIYSLHGSLLYIKSQSISMLLGRILHNDFIYMLALKMGGIFLKSRYVYF